MKKSVNRKLKSGSTITHETSKGTVEEYALASPNYSFNARPAFVRNVFLSYPEPDGKGRKTLSADAQTAYKRLRSEANTVVHAVVDRLGRETIPSLREEGVGYPNATFGVTARSIACSSPAGALQAMPPEGAAALRVTAHLNEFHDDVQLAMLKKLGTSHLIGIEVTGHGLKIAHGTSAGGTGGLLATFKCTTHLLARILHDILLDIGMVHAVGNRWSGLRSDFDSVTLAQKKVAFLSRPHLKLAPAYGAYPVGSGNATYLPLASCCGIGGGLQFDAKRYVALWEEFGDYVRAGAGAAPVAKLTAPPVSPPRLPAARRKSSVRGVQPRPVPPDAIGVEKAVGVAREILGNHPKRGQISASELVRKISILSPGRYVLYMVLRRPKDVHMRNGINAFLQRSVPTFRTQSWAILPSASSLSTGRFFILQGYLSWYEFEV